MRWRSIRRRLMRRRRMLLGGIAGVLLSLAMAGAWLRWAHDPHRLKLQFVASGDRYVAAKQYREAAIQYRSAVAQDPAFGEAYFKLGDADEKTGDLKAALRSYVRAADLMPDRIDAQLHAAKFLVAAGLYADAKTRATAVLAKEPRNVTALMILGGALAGLKDVDGAIEQVDGAIDADPRLTFSYASLGLLKLTQGDRAAAESAFARAVAADPSSMPARLNLGNFYWASGDRARAERELKAALAMAPASAQANRILAAFYLTNGQRKIGEPYLVAFATAAADAGPKLALADFYLADGRTTDAARVLGPLAGDPQGAGPATLRLAGIAFVAGRREDAYRALDDILKTRPFDDAVLDAKARFLFAERRYDEALAVATTAVKANPRDVRSRYLRGMAFEALGQTEEAAKAFQDVLSVSPGALPAEMHLANLDLTSGDTEAAIEFLRQVTTADPSSGNAHVLLGRALLQTGDLAGAEAQFTRLAAVNPSAPEMQVWLGHLAMAKNDFVGARRAYARALELDPHSLDGLKGLITIDLYEKKLDALRTRLAAQLRARPTDPALLCLAGKSYVRVGEAALAEAAFRRALALAPNSLDAYLGLGGLFVFQHRLDEALTEYKAVARQEARPVVATTLIGIILQLQHKLDEASREYERAIAIDPRAAVAANNLAWIYADRGDHLDEALQLVKSAKAQLPDNPQVSDTMGWIYYKKDLAALAVASLRRAAQQDPADADIRYHLGLAYLKNGDVSQAQQQLQQALTLNPGFDAADDARRVIKTIQ